VKLGIITVVLGLLFGCSLAQREAGAQTFGAMSADAQPGNSGPGPFVRKGSPPWKLVETRLQEIRQDIEQKAAYIASAAHSAEKRKELREELEVLVEAEFELRQRLQNMQLEDFQGRMEEIKLAMSLQSEMREEMINSQLDRLMQGKPAEPTPTSNIIPGPASLLRNERSPAIAPPAKTDPSLGTIDPLTPGKSKRDVEIHQQRSSQRNNSDDSSYDLETQEELAQLDVRAAEQELVEVAGRLTELKEAKKAGVQGWLADLPTLEKEHGLAEIAVERAKVKHQGILRAAFFATRDADRALESVGKKVAAAQKSVNDLLKQLHQLEADLAKAETQSALMYKKYNQAWKDRNAGKAQEEEVQEALGENNKAEAAQKKLEAAIDSIRKKIEQATAELKQAEAEVDPASLRYQKARDQRDMLERKQKDRLKKSAESTSAQEASDAKIALDAAEANAKDLSSRVKDLSEQLRKRTTELAASLRTSDKLEKTQSQRVQEAADQVAIQEISSELRQAKNELGQAQEEVAQANQRLAKVEAQRDGVTKPAGPVRNLVSASRKW